MDNKESGSIVLCIGSQNPAKVRGVMNAFSHYFRVEKFVTKKVDTGLPPQPIGLGLILEGARRRAELSLSEECDYSVGIEAGFYIVGDEPYDVEAAYVLEKSGVGSLGFSPSFPIPRRIYEWILRGEYKELEDAVNALFKVENIGDKEGFIGLLTKRVCDRWVLSYYATLMALVRFLNRDLYST